MARGQTPLFHHIGSFLLLAAGALLLVTTITSPVVSHLSLLTVTLDDSGDASVTFGTFGYCARNAPPITSNNQDFCSPRTIGYDVASVMSAIEGSSFSTASASTANGLTRVMILHPVACALSFLAFLLALGSGICGSLFASMVSGIAFLITLVVMACDFAAFGIIRNNVNGDDTDSRAEFGVGMWTVLAAMVALFLGTIIVFFSCCVSRRRSRNDVRHSKVDHGYAEGGVAVQRRRRFWQRRSRY